jgi:molybdopterin converting factor small subunit
MTVTVRFHGIVGDVAKRKEQSIELDEGAIVADLMSTLAASNPGLAAAAKQVRAVGNGETAGKEMALKDGDEIVLMRAIGGGE